MPLRTSPTETIVSLEEKIVKLEKEIGLIKGLPGGNLANQLLGTNAANEIKWLAEIGGLQKFNEISASEAFIINLVLSGAVRWKVVDTLLTNIAAQGILEIPLGGVSLMHCAKETSIEGFKNELGGEYAAGTEAKILNTGAFGIKFLNAAVATSFEFSGGELKLEPKHSLSIVYIGTKKRWIDISKT